MSLTQQFPFKVMMPAQFEKATRFRDLHQRDRVFLIPNPWDGGSARVLEKLGFEALATSSSASAATLARTDGNLTRDEAIAHCRVIASSTNLPVSGDLENGFGRAPEDAALTVQLAGAAGLVGCSIEDSTNDKRNPLFEITHATERISAAVEAARGFPFPFMLTARAEVFTSGSGNLDEAIRRLQAYERAGADVLFAPGLPTLEAVREVCMAVRKPVNFMVTVRGKSFSVAELAAVGVKRISFASSLYRAAIGGLLKAAREIQSDGTFHYLQEIPTGMEWASYLQTTPEKNN